MSDRKMSNFRWIICSLLFFATTVNYLDRQVLSLTYKDFIAPVFGWSDTDSGTICAKYNLDEEIPYEMEDLAIRDGWIYVNTNTSPRRGQGKPVVYKLAMPK